MNVLIADDDPVARQLVVSFLTRWGEQVTAAEDGAAAWNLFRAGDYPVVITDWMMPNLDGLELIRRIRAHPTPGYVYTILLTSLSEKKDLVHGMEAGADDYLAKPFDREELRVRLRQGQRVVGLERSVEAKNRALRETQAVMVQQEKLASLGHLAAGVAHEINNPVAYVGNNLAVLRRDVLAALDLLNVYRAARPALEAAAPAVAAEAARREEQIGLVDVLATLPRLFDTTLDGLKRVRDIVRNLRDFARLDEADEQDADLNAAVMTTAGVLGHEFTARGVELRTDFGPLPPVRCRPAKVNQALLNILRNAAQASEAGGVVEVRTRADGADVVIEVEDHGCGIPPEYLPRLFEPFFTTRPVGQGAGLGLAVSYGIVRDHGGTITVDSAPGRGSLFRVRLPAARKPTGGAARA
jgi:two-component system, NtrC family, sensor kinase